MGMSRTGFAVPVSGPWATQENLDRLARRAEELGYASLWTFQRLLDPVGRELGPPYRSVLDPVVALAHLSGVTSRVELGVAVVNVFTQPVPLAKQLATLQTLSGGRLLAGLGLGWMPEEFTASGVPFEARGRRGEEFVALLRACWTEEVVEHHGEFYQVPAARVAPKPSPAPPPLLLGAAADRALRRAGRIADGWVSASGEDLTEIGKKIYIVKEAAEQAGRDPDALRFVIRGSTRLLRTGERGPLVGTEEQIRQDVADLFGQGVTDLFHDLNFDPEIVTAAPEEAMRRAEETLTALTP